jgi:hypothetical protein
MEPGNHSNGVNLKNQKSRKYLKHIKMGLFDSLFGKKKMTLEDADKKNDEFIGKNPVAKNDEDEMMRKICRVDGAVQKTIGKLSRKKRIV